MIVCAHILYNTNNTCENELHLLDVTLHYIRTFRITLVLCNFTQNKYVHTCIKQTHTLALTFYLFHVVANLFDNVI